MNRSEIKTYTVASLAAMFLVATTQASVLWSATSPSSFKGIEKQDCNGNYGSNNGSSATSVSDPSVSPVIKFHKVSTDRRCEGKGANGFTVTQGSTYYIGWRFKLSSTVNDNCFFQWKSYGSPMNQNYPLVIKMISGQLNLQYYVPNGGGTKTLYRANVSANTWYRIVLKVKVSSSTTGGNVQFFWNGSSSAATLLTGGTSFTGKTFDGSEINPKWGKYGACGSTIDSYVGHLRIGTGFSDANP
jgi:hypothetical protein